MAEDIPLVLDTVAGFSVAVFAGAPRPVYTWVKQQDGTIHVEIDAANPPSNVSVWSTTTIDGKKRRDFRLVALMPLKPPPAPPQPFLHPVFWAQHALAPSPESNSTTIIYDVLMPPPAQGWVSALRLMLLVECACRLRHRAL